MALVHAVAVRNAVAELVTDLLDGGTLVFLTTGDVEVATLVFGDPAFGAPDEGVVEANALTPDADATGGTASKFEARDDANDVVLEGTVATVGADLLGNPVIAPADTVAIEELTYEAMP